MTVSMYEFDLFSSLSKEFTFKLHLNYHDGSVSLHFWGFLLVTHKNLTSLGRVVKPNSHGIFDGQPARQYPCSPVHPWSNGNWCIQRFQRNKEVGIILYEHWLIWTVSHTCNLYASIRASLPGPAALIDCAQSVNSLLFYLRSIKIISQRWVYH